MDKIIIKVHIFTEEILFELIDYISVEQAREEIWNNISSQTPHWEYLTNEGVNLIKGTEGVKYK